MPPPLLPEARTINPLQWAFNVLVHVNMELFFFYQNLLHVLGQTEQVDGSTSLF